MINLCREYFSFDNSLHQAFRGLNPNFRLECRYLERFPQLYDYMDYGDILSEYEKFRCEVVYRLPSFSMEIEEFWGECLKLNHLRKLSLFFTKIVTIPQSSAAVERLFSTLSAKKTEKRNRLGQETLEALLRIQKHHQNNENSLEITEEMLQRMRNFNVDEGEDSDRE